MASSSTRAIASWFHARNPLRLGVAGTTLLALGSFGAGAIRNRGGILDALGLDFLSYGHGAGLSNALVWVGIALVVAAWVRLGKATVFDANAGNRDPALEERRVRTLYRALLSWLFPLLFAAPILSRDVYSYLMQGAMLRDGFNPYRQGAAVNPGPFLLEVSHDWRNTTTPYGPLHLWIGEAVTRLVGDNVTAGVACYKVLSVIGFIAVAWSVPKIARELGGSPALALWLGVANPVMVLHLVGGMHNESIMVGLVSMGLWLALRHRFFAAVALIAVSVSLKATAAIALPFVVWMATRHWAAKRSGDIADAADTRAVVRPVIAGASYDSTTLSGIPARRWVPMFLLAGTSLATLTLAVVGVITWLSGASWGWVSQISGNSKVINPLALPSLLAGIITPVLQLFDDQFPYNAALSATRTASSVLMLVGLAAVWWLFRKTNRDNVGGILSAYGVAFTFNSVTLPWYYASLLNFVGVFTPPVWLVKCTIAGSILISFAFTGSGNHQLYNLIWMGVVAVLAWGALGYLMPTRLAVPPTGPRPKQRGPEPAAGLR